MLDCLFIGSSTKDTLLLVDAPPASDQRIAASAVVHTCGGVASVAASAFQKLGGSAGLITAVGVPSDVTDFITKKHHGQKPSLCVTALRTRDKLPIQRNSS